MKPLITVAIIVIIIALYVASVVRSIKIKFDELANVAFSGFNLNSLNLNQTVITARVKLIVTLSSLFSIIISNLNIKAYKNNSLIAESTPNFSENTKKITLTPDINNEIYQTFNFHVNPELLDLILKLKSKQAYTINYIASFKIFGIPVTKNGIFNKQ